MTPLHPCPPVLQPLNQVQVQNVRDGTPPGSQAVCLRKRLIMLARLDMLVALAIVVLGIVLVRGVPG